MNNAEDAVAKVRTFAKTYIWLSPINIREEKSKFINSRTYNPKFKYPQVDKNNLKAYKYKLKKAVSRKQSVRKAEFNKARLKETRLRLNLISNIGNPRKITLTTQKLYGLTFQKKYLKLALKDALINASFRSNKNIPANETVSQVKRYLKKLEITGWKVEITPRLDFYTQIRASEMRILISDQINWDFTTLDSMLAHEIDGHVTRAENAKKQSGIYSKRFPFYLKTEEGLASFLGDYCAEGGEISLKHHAVKYLGGYVALNNSFRETYNFFLDYGFTRTLAFQRALRLKRGLTDTGHPGCNAREAMYYEGMLEVKKYIENGGNINKLFAGKCGLNDIEIIPYLKNSIIPERIKLSNFGNKTSKTKSAGYVISDNN